MTGLMEDGRWLQWIRTATMVVIPTIVVCRERDARETYHRPRRGNLCGCIPTPDRVGAVAAGQLLVVHVRANIVVDFFGGVR